MVTTQLYNILDGILQKKKIKKNIYIFGKHIKAFHVWATGVGVNPLFQKIALGRFFHRVAMSVCLMSLFHIILQCAPADWKLNYTPSSPQNELYSSSRSEKTFPFVCNRQK